MSTFADSYAKQLYAQVPGHYRYYDGERREPLLALLRVIAEQVGNIHQDLYALWDNFFIETCADWAVPYIGALVGANLLPNNVDGANRLVVWNTARWRQSRGTVPTLLGMAGVSTGWPVDLVEFFDEHRSVL